MNNMYYLCKTIFYCIIDTFGQLIVLNVANYVSLLIIFTSGLPFQNLPEDFPYFIKAIFFEMTLPSDCNS